MQKEAAPPAIAAAEACSEQAAERKGEDVAIPMQAVEVAVVVEQTEDREIAKETQGAGVFSLESTEQGELPGTQEISLEQDADVLDQAPIAPAPYKNPNLKLTDPRAKQSLAVTAQTVVHPELNILRHADFIFSPPHARDLHKPRSKTWVVASPDGRKLKSSLLVEPFRDKRPTTRTFKVFLSLQHLLECKGWDSQERTLFSYRELATILKWKWLGKRTIKALDEELEQLRGTLFTWRHCFIVDDGEVYTLLDRVTILDKLSTLRKEDRKREEFFEDANIFRYDETIRKTLKANQTKPLYLLTALDIEGEIEPQLYTRLDRFLVEKEVYERNSAPLFFEDLRLEGEEYHKPSQRKAKLKKMIARIQGKSLSSGGALRVSIEKTKDGKDWKLVARKIYPRKQRQAPASSPHPESPVASLVAEYRSDLQSYANPIEAISGYQDELENTLRTRPGIWRLYFRGILTRYPYEGLVERALAAWTKEDHSAQTDEERVRTFNNILHRLAHGQGMSWSNKDECPKDCQYLATDLSKN